MKKKLEELKKIVVIRACIKKCREHTIKTNDQFNKK